MTAVEWLENEIKNSKYYYKIIVEINSRSTIAQPNVFEQAKEMEKQQIILSHINGQSEYDSQAFSSSNTKIAEHYYNKTFKKK